MQFGIIYNINTGKIESMVVPENELEIHTDILGKIKLFNYQKMEKFNLYLFNIDVNKMQELLNSRIQ